MWLDAMEVDRMWVLVVTYLEREGRAQHGGLWHHRENKTGISATEHPATKSDIRTIKKTLILIHMKSLNPQVIPHLIIHLTKIFDFYFVQNECTGKLTTFTKLFLK